MSGPWFSYGRRTSYGRSNSYGAESSYGRAAGAEGPATSGDPMLVEGLATTRAALLGALPLPDRAAPENQASQRWRDAGDGLPAMGSPESLDSQGAEVRAALVQFEVLSSLSFESPQTPADWARLKVGTDTLLALRRPPRSLFLAELARIQAQAPLRASRAAEILTQIAPPHAYFGAVLGLQAGKHPRTLELVEATLAAAYTVGQRFKQALAVPRPTEFSGQIQPMIEVPQHGAFPAGHAIEAHVTARVLGALCATSVQQRTLLRALADRVAENRIVAGVHFPIDCHVGRLIGDCLGSYLLSACGVDESSGVPWQGASFDGTTAAPGDFGPSLPGTVPTSGPRADLPLYARLWARARLEWPEQAKGNAGKAAKAVTKKTGKKTPKAAKRSPAGKAAKA